MDRMLSGAGANLVEAVRAVDRSIVAREERHQGLAPALGADRGVHLALPPVPAAGADPQRTVLLGDGAAALATLGLVDEALAGVELLLPGGKDEVHAAVATADGLVGVHPSASCLARPARIWTFRDLRGP